jgi:sugar transferase (PEP-CTERM/EpsH1 system associated)
VLYLTHRLPYAPNRGDRIRSYHFLQQMARFATVDLFSFVSEEEEERQKASVPINGELETVRAPRLFNMAKGALSLWTQRPLTHALLDAPDMAERLDRLVTRRRPDVVLAYCTGMARFALEGPLSRLPFVLDFVDVDSVKWQEYAERSRGPAHWIYVREASTLRRFEARAALAASSSLVTTHRERDALLRIAPRASVTVVPVGLDSATVAPPPDSAPESSTVVFCGMMDYRPNVEGACWFAEHVWPTIRRARPDARLILLGANPTAAVRGLAKRDHSIEVTGRVPDVRPYLWNAAASIAPLHVARGVQTKVLEAVGSGLPVVITPAVRDGLHREVLPACDVAESPDDFATAVVRLMALTPDARRRRADTASISDIAWNRCLEPLERILVEASASRRGDSVNSVSATRVPAIRGEGARPREYRP